MKYEYRKLYRNRLIRVLLIFVILLNAFVYYSYLSENKQGYSYLDMSQKYYSNVDLDEDIKNLQNEAASSASGMNESLLTRYYYSEIDMDRELIHQSDTIDLFPAQIQEMLDNNLICLRVGKGIDSYVRKSMEKIADIYEPLLDIKIHNDFSQGLLAFIQFRIQDIFFIFWIMVSVLGIWIWDAASGMLSLLKPTYKGYWGLYQRKYLALSGSVVCGLFLTYGVTLGITIHYMGIGNLSRSIQSVYGFELCPFRITVAGFLVNFMLSKLLCGFLIATFIVTLSLINADFRLVFLGCGVSGLLAYIMGDSNNLWIRSFSISYQMDITKHMQNCIILNFFGIPVRQWYFILLLQTFCVCVLLGCGLFLYVNVAVSLKDKSPAFSICIPDIKICNQVFQEFYKYYIKRGAFIVFSLFLILQINTYGNIKYWTDSYYKSYSEILNGEKTPEKNAYLERESNRLEKIHQTIEQIESQQFEDSSTKDMLISEYESLLSCESGFEAAKAHYENAADYYVYESGYELLYGTQNRSEDMLNLLKCIFVLILCFAGIKAREEETGVAILIKTSGMEKKIDQIKLLIIVISALIVLLIGFLPQLIHIEDTITLPVLYAPANSLQIFQIFPNMISISGAIILIFCIRYILLLLVCKVIWICSKKIKDTYYAGIVSLGIVIFLFLIVRFLPIS